MKDKDSKLLEETYGQILKEYQSSIEFEDWNELNFPRDLLRLIARKLQIKDFKYEEDSPDFIGRISTDKLGRYYDNYYIGYLPTTLTVFRKKSKPPVAHMGWYIVTHDDYLGDQHLVTGPFEDREGAIEWAKIEGVEKNER